MSRRLTVATGAEGPKVARVSSATAEALSIDAGAVVTLEGRRRAVARAVVDGDLDDETVLLDETTRENADADVGDRIDVAATAAPSADRVVLAPRHTIRIRGGADVLRERLSGLPVRVDEQVRVTLFGGALELPFVVVATDPTGAVTVDEATTVEVRESTAADRGARPALANVTYDDVGGLQRERAALADAERVLRGDDVYDRLGGQPPTGVLLAGPSGIGKTRLVNALVTETGAAFVPVDTLRLAEAGGEDADRRVTDVIEEARREAPALVYLDHVDVVATDDDGGDRGRRLVARLGRLLDGLSEVPGVVVVGEARALGDVATPLRRGGRFDRELEFHAPDRNGRRELLTVHTRGLRLSEAVDFDELAARAHGFVGADVAALCRAAVAAAAARIRGEDPAAALGGGRRRVTAPATDRLQSPDGESGVAGGDGSAHAASPATVDGDTDARITPADFEVALRAVEPSGMRGVSVEVPSATYDDVGGLEDVKRELVRAVEWPIRYPDLFGSIGITPPKGILLYGPPGTGKTLLARAVANATDANFISVKGPELLNKYVGESERAVREVFERARQNSPAVVFFDEVDAVSPERSDDDSGAPERVVSQLLTELDGVEELTDVTVIGATNRPDRIDPALLRPGRFERIVEVPMPDEAAREEILNVHTRTMSLQDVDLRAVARRTEGYTGSDLEALVREAGMLAVEDALDAADSTTNGDATDGTDLAGAVAATARKRVTVTADHVERALTASKPSVSADKRSYYERLDETGVR
jgi:transitional endoplasmic reticulum ATPase